MERLETKHWSCDPSDETVIRPNDIIEIFGLNNTDDPTNVGEFEDDIKPLLPQILSAESFALIGRQKAEA